MSEVVECVERSDVVMDGGWPRDLSAGQGPAANRGGGRHSPWGTGRPGHQDPDDEACPPAPVKYTLRIASYGKHLITESFCSRDA